VGAKGKGIGPILWSPIPIFLSHFDETWCDSFCERGGEADRIDLILFLCAPLLSHSHCHHHPGLSHYISPKSWKVEMNGNPSLLPVSTTEVCCESYIISFSM
jgi:hypothetical protein